MKNKKIPRILLTVLMIFSVLLLFSCGDAKTPGNSDNNAATNEVGNGEIGGDEAGTTGDAEILPNLPDVRYDGYVFTFLTHREAGDGDWRGGDRPLEITSEIEDTIDPICDAVYKRNDRLSAKYGIEIKMVSFTDENAVLDRTVKADDPEYDAVLMFNNFVPGIITKNLLVNVVNLPYINLSKPWWDPAVTSMSIVNKNYLLGGDMLILDNEATNALIFNKELLQTLDMEYPYKFVLDGTWTLEKFNQMIKDTAADLNGDGKIDYENDRYGLMVYNDAMHAFLVSGGEALARKDKDDIPYMDFTNQRALQVIDKVMDIMYNKQDVLNIQTDVPYKNGPENWRRIYNGGFEEGRALFLWLRMRVVDKFRGMDADFGIVPLPKLDENQEKYYSVVNSYSGALAGVPKSARDLERTSVILEAMAFESRDTLQPAYYDIVLQRKNTRDEESREMLDIIFGSRVYDIAAVYGFGNAFIEFINLTGKLDRNVASFYEKHQGAMEGDIEKIVEIFRAMN